MMGRSHKERKKAKSPILEAVHETATGLYEVGAIDEVAMRKFDQLCFEPDQSAERG